MPVPARAQPFVSPPPTTINAALDRHAERFDVNEAFLTDQFERLLADPPTDGDRYWLTLARITELALFVAGSYADAGEIRAAGDLLINPRRIMVHVRGRIEPVLKRRHQPMTRQFAKYADGGDVKRWLKHNTWLETVRPPLLPHLVDLMAGGGRIDADYLASVQNRARRVADAVNLVSSCLAGRTQDFQEYLAGRAPEDRAFIEGGLCRFDLTVFWEMGREIHRMERNRGRGGRFLRPRQESAAQNPFRREINNEQSRITNLFRDRSP